jgi:hypothetical protein
VRKLAGDNLTKNTSTVQIEDSEVGRRTVISREQQVAKSTSYNPTLEASEPKKQRREVISDGEGVVVKKTSTQAVFKNEINESVRVTETESGDTIIEGAVAKEVTYEASDPAIVTGSTTQAQTVGSKIGSNPKKAAEEKAKRLKQVGAVILDKQEGVVVKKVRKDEGEKTSAEGFVAKLSVGKNEEKRGEVEFGGDVDGIIGGEATVSSGGPSVVDASDAGVDISDILDNIK